MTLLLLLSLFTTSADTTVQQTFSPDTVSVSTLQDHTVYFSLKGVQFIGADNLLREAKDAQFVALGEIHNSRKLSEFTSALMYLLKPEGYEDLIVETGPYSAEKLQNLMNFDNAQKVVSEFYDNYSSNLFQYYVIPFFIGKGDLEMLETVHKLDFDLTGIDQEFYFSGIFLAEELKNRSDEPLSLKQLNLLKKINRKFTWWYRRSSVFSSFDLSCRIKNYDPFKDYIASFREPNSTQQSIIDALNISLDIYCLNESGNWSEGNQKRIDYFKTNFDSWYRESLESDSSSLPKAILKMGSYHSGRYQSPNGIYDIGNHVVELADSLGTKSLHLRFLNRYFEGGRDVIEEPNWSSSEKFISLAKRDEWTLIDTRALRQRILDKKLTGSRFEVREILNYDYIIIMPEDVRASKHY